MCASTERKRACALWVCVLLSALTARGVQTNDCAGALVGLDTKNTDCRLNRASQSYSAASLFVLRRCPSGALVLFCAVAVSSSAGRLSVLVLSTATSKGQASTCACLLATQNSRLVTAVLFPCSYRPCDKNVLGCSFLRCCQRGSCSLHNSSRWSVLCTPRSCERGVTTSTLPVEILVANVT